MKHYTLQYLLTRSLGLFKQKTYGFCVDPMYEVLIESEIYESLRAAYSFHNISIEKETFCRRVLYIYSQILPQLFLSFNKRICFTHLENQMFS